MPDSTLWPPFDGVCALSAVSSPFKRPLLTTAPLPQGLFHLHTATPPGIAICPQGSTDSGKNAFFRILLIEIGCAQSEKTLIYCFKARTARHMKRAGTPASPNRIAAAATRGLGRFLDALAFLSRLAPPRSFTDASLIASVPWFAAVGLALGCLFALTAVLALTFLYSLSAGPTARTLSAVATAWLWLSLEIWSTRGLHWDGLADLGDACGSGAHGARFREILRDSRLGAFGALSLLLVFSGQWAALAWHLADGHWLALALAPAWGRACAVWLAASAPAFETASLGGLACAGASPALSRAYTLVAVLAVGVLLAFGLGVWQGLALLAGQYWLTRRLAGIAREQGGLSGDFLGAAIELGQLWFLLATV